MEGEAYWTEKTSNEKTNDRGSRTLHRERGREERRSGQWKVEGEGRRSDEGRRGAREISVSPRHGVMSLTVGLVRHVTGSCRRFDEERWGGGGGEGNRGKWRASSLTASTATNSALRRESLSDKHRENRDNNATTNPPTSDGQ